MANFIAQWQRVPPECRPTEKTAGDSKLGKWRSFGSCLRIMTFSGKFRQKYADGPFSTSSHQPELIFLIPSLEIAASQPRNGCWRDPIDVVSSDMIGLIKIWQFYQLFDLFWHFFYQFYPFLDMFYHFLPFSTICWHSDIFDQIRFLFDFWQFLPNSIFVWPLPQLLPSQKQLWNILDNFFTLGKPLRPFWYQLPRNYSVLETKSMPLAHRLYFLAATLQP